MRSKIPLFDHPPAIPGQPPVMRLEDIRDDGIYTVTWKEGHTTTTIVANEKFQILADLAIEAFCDRYYREAVLTCASALDAYMDFHIEVMLRSRETTADTAAAVLKLTSRQAERRLGAFLTVEAAAGNFPTHIEQTMVELRNSIVHKGYIPTEGETLEYLDHVIAFIVARYAHLYSKHQALTMKLFFERISTLPKPTTPGRGHATLSMQTVITALAFKNSPEVVSLADYITWWKKRKATLSY